MTIFGPHHEIRTLVDLLRWRAQHCAKQLAYVFVTEGAEPLGSPMKIWTYQSRVIGGFLQSLGETGSPGSAALSTRVGLYFGIFRLLYAGRNSDSFLPSTLQPAGCAFARGL